MTIASNLSFRLAAILLAGFIALQLLIAAVSLPATDNPRRAHNLPLPEEAAAIVGAIDRAPPGERVALARTLDGALYSLRLVPRLPDRWKASAELEDIAGAYRSVLPGRGISVEGRRPRFGGRFGATPRAARFFAPIRVGIALRSGGVLLVTSRPSDRARAYLQGRAVVGALGGLVLLIALLFAVRQTTRPLAALSSGVRGLAEDLDAPDLPETGPREVRALAAAFNAMKREIRALMAERTRVLGAIAHDLRTYLTRLRLRAEYIDDPGQRARAVRDLDEMTALVNDTLVLADRDAAPTPRPERVALAPMLADIVGAHVELGGAVALGPVPDTLAIAATPLALRRMLDNLIGNGLRHGEQVAVTVVAGAGWIDIAVEDDGPGVPPELLATLGQPFHRLDPSRSRDTGGAGLGLAIVRALADRDRATLVFETGVAGGLRVTLRYRPADPPA
ncbi:ATP-binding protein [Sphingomonas hengshuiensis]|uniref:histidine kinase n=1 Tax=Sphingomonas hengshuiensis TaxID=1609977 RepID=A0A7U4LGJ4_9SPHN|nr:ATP-binding protein [Sphingomonas hengshuiensis]AJP73363.1 histidine kinase [Sphingomonas hengshuiensis]